MIPRQKGVVFERGRMLRYIIDDRIRRLAAVRFLALHGNVLADRFVSRHRIRMFLEFFALRIVIEAAQKSVKFTFLLSASADRQQIL